VHHPELYDGGVDGEGALSTPHTVFTFLLAALQHYPVYDHAARRRSRTPFSGFR